MRRRRVQVIIFISYSTKEYVNCKSTNVIEMSQERDTLCDLCLMGYRLPTNISWFKSGFTMGMLKLIVRSVIRSIGRINIAQHGYIVHFV